MTRLSIDQLCDADPRIACGGDDAYAMPIAVTIRSALEALDPGRRLGVYLLDAGIRAASRRRIERSLPDERVAIEWLRPDPRAFGGLPVVSYISTASYMRLLLPELAPPQLEKIIYLDSDLVIRDDLAQLWERPLDASPCLAAQDVGAPYLDAEIALDDFERCAPYLVETRPVENYRELGLEATSAYFNSGVLVIDLEAWRKDSIGRAALECIAKNRRHVLYADQYGLNVVLSGRWSALPPRWNSSIHLLKIPSAQECAYDEASFEAARNDPAIIHYTGARKPWQLGAGVPLAQTFHAARRKTQWRGAVGAAERLRAGARRLPDQARRLRKKIKRSLKQRPG